MVHVPEVLGGDALARCRAALKEAEWVDGRETAGHQSGRVKHNRQVREGSAAARQAGGLILEALERSPLFISSVLPRRVFTRCSTATARDALRLPRRQRHPSASPAPPSGCAPMSPRRCSCPIPDSYDGGELVVEDTYGSHSVKLPAGDLIVYPASSLHHVTPVTRGGRGWPRSSGSRAWCATRPAVFAVRPGHGHRRPDTTSSPESPVAGAAHRREL